MNNKRSMIPECFIPGTSRNIFLYLILCSFYLAMSEKGMPNENSELIEVLSLFLWLYILVYWLKRDSLHYNVKLPSDIGSLFLSGWFIILPWYLLTTRGYLKTLLYSIIFFLAFIVMSICAWLLLD